MRHPAAQRTEPTPSPGTGNGNGAKVSPLASPSDDLNKQIIRLLQDDGRLPYDEIAARLSVSAGTVRNRVTRMREAGLLQIVAVVDPVAVDYETDAMLGIKTAPGIPPQQVADRLAGYAAVVYIVWVSGQFDLLIEVVCDEEVEFTDFLNRVIYGHADIAHVEVMTRIGMFKNQFLLKRHIN
jgi:Lrp/AsnC family transcriptional regulator for asnA, asnC and gidA